MTESHGAFPPSVRQQARNAALTMATSLGLSVGVVLVLRALSGWAG